MVNILVYRDLIVPKSEIAFLRRQYLGFEHLTPHWIGRKITPLAPQLTKDPILIGGEGPGGIPARILFKQFGIVTPSPEIAALAPRLVHAQFGRGGALALPLARVLGVPLVVTYHGGDASKDKHYRPGLIPSVYQRRLTALKETASLFICVSESVRAKLIERGFPADKLIVNPIGVEMPPAPQGRTEEHLLFVGRFVEKKGLAVLIEAMRRVRANGVTTPLVLVGDGPLFTDIQHAASDISGLSFLGWQEGEAVRRNMERAVAVLVPSVRAAGGDAEGLPRRRHPRPYQRAHGIGAQRRSAGERDCRDHCRRWRAPDPWPSRPQDRRARALGDSPIPPTRRDPVGADSGRLTPWTSRRWAHAPSSAVDHCVERPMGTARSDHKKK
jgi:colanic acid/amylovoran biosynthesis glycosyltransferase